MQIKFQSILFMKNSRNLTGATNTKSGGTYSRSRSSVLSALGIRQTRPIESIASNTQRIGESNDRKKRQNYAIVKCKFFDLTFNRNELKNRLHLADLLLVELSDDCRPSSFFSPFPRLADAILIKVAMQIAATVTCRIVASKSMRIRSSYTFESGS
jgi:hypothetical protein